jgi:hypothetical protein
MKKSKKLRIPYWFLLCALLLAIVAGARAAEPRPTDLVEIDSMQSLYAAVTFDHVMHESSYECSVCHHFGETAEQEAGSSCKKCHNSGGEPTLPILSKPHSCATCHQQHSGTKNFMANIENQGHSNWLFHFDTPSLIGAYHLQCLNCHKEEGGPEGCTDCHALLPKGRQFFWVKDK